MINLSVKFKVISQPATSQRSISMEQINDEAQETTLTALNIWRVDIIKFIVR